MLVPPGVVTVTLTDPADPLAGTALTVMLVSELTVKGAEFEPNFTVVVPVKWLPVKVTVFPPDCGPCGGETLERTGVAISVLLDNEGLARRAEASLIRRRRSIAAAPSAVGLA